MACPAVTGDAAMAPSVRMNWTVASLASPAPASDAKNSIGTFVRPRWSINQHQSRGKKAAGPTVTRGGLPHAQSRNPVHELSSVLLSYPSFGYFLRGLRTRRAPAVTVGRNFVVVRSGIPFATELASFYPPLISFPRSSGSFAHSSDRPFLSFFECSCCPLSSLSRSLLFPGLLLIVD